MGGFLAFLLRKPITINIVTALVMVIGLMKGMAMRREAFPTVNFDVVAINTVYPGASAQEVEQYVTTPIEREVYIVSGIDELTSTSIENLSMIIAKLDPDLSQDEKDQAITDIQRAVDRVRDLPDDLPDPPEVIEVKSSAMPVIEVALSGDLPYENLHRLAEDLGERLEEIRDVERVELKGWEEPEFWVEVAPEKIRQYAISLGLITQSLAARNVNIPGGTLKLPGNEALVRTIGEVQGAKEIGEVVLRANDAGRIIKVDDVARVRSAFEEPSQLYRTNGSQSINLIVLKAKNGDIIRLVDRVKETVAQFSERTGETKLKVSFVNDISEFVRNRLSVLTSNGLVGTALVFASLILSLSPGIALVTAAGMPTAVLATGFVLGYMGMTINLISMFGFIIVLGMLVDDAIIVAENIWQHFEGGKTAWEAVIDGTKEVAWPVTATVLTTIAAFSPLLMISGIMGKFMAEMPKVVIVALSCSLIESLFVLPSHAYDILRLKKHRPKGSESGPAAESRPKKVSLLGIGVILDWSQKIYVSLLAVMLRWRYLFVAGILALFAGSVGFAIKRIPFILFPAEGVEAFFIRGDLPVGAGLEQTTEHARPVEQLVARLPSSELKDYVTNIGIQRNDPNDPFTQRGSNVFQVAVYLTPESARERRADQIIEALRLEAEPLAQKTGLTRISFERVRNGPPVGKPVAIKVRGDDLEEIRRVAEKVAAVLGTRPGVQDISTDYLPGKEEIQVRNDEKAAAASLLTIRQVAQHVRAALGGEIASFVRAGEDRIPIRVRFPEDERRAVRSLEGMQIVNNAGHLVPLSRIAHLERRHGITAIKHLDKKRVVSATANVDEAVTSSERVNRAIDQDIRQIDKEHPDVMVSAGGEFEDTQESLRDLRMAFIIALGLVYIILATQFQSMVQPFVVMSAIPLGLIGVIWAFYAHGLPFSFLAMFGMIGLSGVVVNDSIVLVDFLNKARARGMAAMEAALYAGGRRYRAVWLTTITTVLGVLPLVYGIGGFDKFLQPAAAALGYGLIFGTVLTLFFVPALYLIYVDVWEGIRWVVRKSAKVFGLAL